MGNERLERAKRPERHERIEGTPCHVPVSLEVAIRHVLLWSSTICISVVSPSGPVCEDARTSPPAARESMSIASLDVVMFGSYKKKFKEGRGRDG